MGFRFPKFSSIIIISVVVSTFTYHVGDPSSNHSRGGNLLCTFSKVFEFCKYMGFSHQMVSILTTMAKRESNGMILHLKGNYETL